MHCRIRVVEDSVGGMRKGAKHMCAKLLTIKSAGGGVRRYSPDKGGEGWLQFTRKMTPPSLSLDIGSASKFNLTLGSPNG